MIVNEIEVFNKELKVFTKEIRWKNIDGATFYNIYRSEISYGDFEKINQSPIYPSNSEYTTYIDNPPITDILPFRWWYKVTAVDNTGVESNLDDILPATDLPIRAFLIKPYNQQIPRALSEQDLTYPDDGKIFQYLRSTKINPRWFLEIRRRLIWLLEMGGVPCVLLKRKYSGVLCPNFDPIRNQHKQGFNVDDPCFGTKFLGGYHSPIIINISFINPAVKNIKWENFGLEVELSTKNWTLWEPNLLDKDIIIRIDNGERYEILNVTTTNWRGLPLHQKFDLKLVEPTSIIYKIPLPDVRL